MISASSSSASSAPATSANVVFGRVLADELGLALAELHDAVAAALHLVHEEEQQAQDEQDRQEADEQRDQQALVVDLDVVRDVGVVERVGELAALVEQERRLDLRRALDLDALGELEPDSCSLSSTCDRVAVGVDDVAGLDRGEDLRGRRPRCSSPSPRKLSVSSRRASRPSRM